MATSKPCKVSYNDTIKALVELDPPIVTRHKMAALVGEKEICRNNLAGRCNLGDKCPRSHEVPKGKGPSPTPPGTKTPYPKSDKAMRDTHVRRCLSQSLSPVNTVLLSDLLEDARQQTTHSNHQSRK
jgi:hypothetical protein